MMIFRHVAIGLMALVGCAAGPAFAATVSAIVNYDQSGPGGISLSAATYDVAGSATNALVTPGGTGTAYAEIGILRVGATDAPITVPIHSVNGTRTEATALWRDAITLTTPGAGAGLATFILDLSATTHSNGARPNAGVSSADASVAINDVTYLDVSNVRGFPHVPDALTIARFGQAPVTIYGDYEITGSYLVTLPFTSGVAFSLRVEAVCAASSTPFITGFGSVGNGSAGCDMTHTARWGGLSGIVDSHGASLRHDFTASSQSGFDYIARPPSTVPEPASWMLLIAGFGVAGAALRRQRLAAV